MNDVVLFLIFLVVIVLVIAAVLGVVKAVFALPPLSDLQPYLNVVYALVVLLLIWAAISWLYPTSGHVLPIFRHGG